MELNVSKWGAGIYPRGRDACIPYQNTAWALAFILPPVQILKIPIFFLAPCSNPARAQAIVAICGLGQ